MAIVKMKKFHLLVLNSYREKLLRELQIFRNIQFEDVCEVENFESEDLLRFKRIAVEEEISKYEDQMNQCTYAIDLISKHTTQLTGLKALIEGLPNYTFEEMEKKVSSMDFEMEYSSIKSLGDELASIESSISKRKELIKELEAVSNLDISFNSLNQLKRFKAFVGGVSNKLLETFKENIEKLEFTYCEEVGVYKDEYLFFVIFDKREEEEVLEVFRTGNFNVIKNDSDKLPKERIDELNAEIEKMSAKKDEICKLLGTKSKEISDFKIYFEYLGNLKVRTQAQHEFMASKSVCVLSGYCPDFDTKRLEEVVANVCEDTYTAEFEDVDKNDPDVPIILKNNRLVRAFESVTSTYALPKYNEVDPTPLYAPIYALFFGMMSADVGYGVVLLILTTLGLKICNFTPNMRKNVKFFQLIAVSTAIWGFLYGSYFGASIPGMWRLFDLSKDFMTILIISIIIGGIHLAYGLLIKAYMQVRDGQYVDMFFDVIAWFLTLGGIICFLLSLAGVISSDIGNIGKYVMITGIILLVIGGARASEGNIVKRLVAGIYNVYGISNYIGDFVSYSRLMALGMSGGYIAFSVNMIAGMVWGKTFIGYVAAILILVLFHAFNLFLSCLGAYVHALRLIYVEFFGKFYEGGGKAFKFFRNKAKYINLDRQYED
ncbi:V-type ATP synthase subunit I [Peptostreptococcus russellii]|uniref:V-type ATP synthase subunit I n=1 Tax=Peptostreptococcus russellii TaxID=215200 RepID=UPI0029432590|nr:V-type ATP synthase subunit I [Peptostreptococcus russellii]